MANGDLIVLKQVPGLPSSSAMSSDVVHGVAIRNGGERRAAQERLAVPESKGERVLLAKHF